ncbi:GlsB/YeaQ/YmgE family stress response membrane protein [candidate division KSB1 bacterium]|nr:GlsB/YeaQ/YmgE family stress response membrane protein [candidate division KSB1 bacterium]NIR72627.1 GlsB/YeaQ/YmgE family stress response membrane protein [candidate division KSB1 bacterium]NIS27338.1 GlsB/YeaQ/YmgE family stress response membrane protein [candidate division KSB1 bacterium]NIT73551.1 GlsB/YeaQ/YmgE family stress response membrane protein [candidate division KSB1 bacterium]NIU25399.1 GlsB/YeaQ/YmgE family stress response membrane protein [candidate division KSB1 bacterium]
MHILWWLIVGLIAGWLTGKVMRGKGFGIIGDIVIGLVGAVIGGWLFGQLNVRVDFLPVILAEIIVAFVGAVILVAVLRAFKKA